jgi:hypothetical protein
MMLGAGFQSKYDGNFSVKISRWFQTPNPSTLRSAAGQTADEEPIRSGRRSLFAILAAAVVATALITTFSLRYNDDEGVPFDAALLAASVPPPPVVESVESIEPPANAEPATQTATAKAEPATGDTANAIAKPDDAANATAERAKTDTVNANAGDAANPDRVAKQPPKAKHHVTKRAVRRPVRRVVRPPTPTTEDLYDTR